VRPAANAAQKHASLMHTHFEQLHAEAQREVKDAVVHTNSSSLVLWTHFVLFQCTCCLNWSTLVAPCLLLSLDLSSPSMSEQCAYCGLGLPSASSIKHCLSVFVKCSSALMTCVMPIRASSTVCTGSRCVHRQHNEQ
jgi:hypothetical protein